MRRSGSQDTDLVLVISQNREEEGHNQQLHGYFFTMDGHGWCDICKLSLTSSVVAKQHLSGKNHRKAKDRWENERHAESSNTNTMPETEKKPLEDTMAGLELTDGVFIAQNQIDEQRSIQELGYVIKATGQGICYTCDELPFTSLQHARQHVSGKSHAKRAKQTPGAQLPGVVISSTQEEIAKSREEHGYYIQMRNGGYCDVCKLALSSVQHASQHINGDKHRKIQQEFGTSGPVKKDQSEEQEQVKMESPKDSSPLQNKLELSDGIFIAQNETDERRSIEELGYVIKATGQGVCYTCDGLQFSSESHARQHVTGRSHAKRAKQAPDSHSPDVVIISQTKEEEDQCKAENGYILTPRGGTCFICNVNLTSTDHGKQHLTGKNHKKVYLTWNYNKGSTVSCGSSDEEKSSTNEAQSVNSIDDDQHRVTPAGSTTMVEHPQIPLPLVSMAHTQERQRQFKVDKSTVDNLARGNGFAAKVLHSFPNSSQNLLCVIQKGNVMRSLESLAIVGMLTANPHLHAVVLTETEAEANQTCKEISKSIGQLEITRLNVYNIRTRPTVQRKPVVKFIPLDVSSLTEPYDVIVTHVVHYLDLLGKEVLKWSESCLVLLEDAHHCGGQHPYYHLLHDYNFDVPPTESPKLVGIISTKAAEYLKKPGKSLEQKMRLWLQSLAEPQVLVANTDTLQVDIFPSSAEHRIVDFSESLFKNEFRTEVLKHLKTCVEEADSKLGTTNNSSAFSDCIKAGEDNLERKPVEVLQRTLLMWKRNCTPDVMQYIDKANIMAKILHQFVSGNLASGLHVIYGFKEDGKWLPASLQEMATPYVELDKIYASAFPMDTGESLATNNFETNIDGLYSTAMVIGQEVDQLEWEKQNTAVVLVNSLYEAKCLKYLLSLSDELQKKGIEVMDPEQTTSKETEGNAVSSAGRKRIVVALAQGLSEVSHVDFVLELYRPQTFNDWHESQNAFCKNGAMLITLCKSEEEMQAMEAFVECGFESMLSKVTGVVLA